MRLLAVFAISFLIISCNNKTPDVSGIKINLTTERFEKNLFDTTSTTLSEYLQKLESGNSGFTQTYIDTILGLDPRWPADSIAPIVNNFIKSYRQVYDASEKKFSNFISYENEIKRGLQFVKYYFPSYKFPEKIITYIGPADGVGDALTTNAFLIGLHHHLGKDFPLYKSEEVQNYYPEYISRRFEPEYISVNSMKNVITDIYPERNDDKTLVNQMIEKGKYLYVLSKFLPEKEEYLLIGYTKNQLKDCYENEAVIWDLFVKNELLQIRDKNITKNYIDEGPKTQELGESSPGNIGSFCGWQIVKKYMQKNDKLSLSKLFSTDPETIFQEAKYKP
ncbi:MAG: hypothetical protein V4556_06900 [Bacteroidota bacterium]